MAGRRVWCLMAGPSRGTRTRGGHVWVNGVLGLSGCDERGPARRSRLVPEVRAYGRYSGGANERAAAVLGSSRILYTRGRVGMGRGFGAIPRAEAPAEAAC